MSIKSVYFTYFTLPKHEWALSIVIKVEQIFVLAMFIHRIIWGEFSRLIGGNYSAELNKQIRRTIVIISQLRALFISVVPPRYDKPLPIPTP